MKRMETLDVLRGFALPGIILVNIRQMVHMSTDVSQTDYQIASFLDAAVTGRFYVIFSFLFGVGFFLSGAEKKDTLCAAYSCAGYSPYS
ncbi:heparan-alpha-glucosaminide N-acetyltransferase domain-containing protein [Domibacillus indicus]|uniref:heparan-alpha-glucosaminide N-acetyltransferase domain-containing protein n=1 Tax=Domibacillus indicus TaxID=1437523 RepID=UPI000617E135|nr:heparan-alpha-glucosaminide N-acetyltransferase domain-containing protein [Domibacillus indicus]